MTGSSSGLIVLGWMGGDGTDNSVASVGGVDNALRFFWVFAIWVSPSVVRNKECALWPGLPGLGRGL